ncbi:MAG: 3-ketoacyl-ACP reductase, partial [Pseudomonadota bacterium]|nr:3-ketoacyl-ACP reductase [Pseudomonadota bacterium]
MSKVALITGGSKGIGLGIAQALIAEGYKVAIVARQDESAPAIQEVLRTLRQQGEAIYRSFDVGNAAKDSGALLDAVELELGPLTTLVNNAGMGSPARGDMLEVVPENMDRVMKVNLYGAFFLAQAAARRMLATHIEAYKSLHFVSSVSADMVSIERAEYCLSKSAAGMMAQLFAVRLAPEGIGVFELRPGIIATDMTAGVKDKYDARIEGGLVPAGRWGLPADIGSTVVPLARGD